MAVSTTRRDIAAAREAGVIDGATYDRLDAFLAERAAQSPEAPRFDFVNLLWYAGALVVLGAMGMFTTTAFSIWGDSALLTTALVYAALFTMAGAYVWKARGLHTPGGLLIACAVGMAPMAIYAAQSLAGHAPIDAAGGYHDFYVWIKSSWLPMEVGTIVAAVIALAFFPFPFIVMIIAFALWFMSMDLTPWLLDMKEFTWDQRAKVSMFFGLLMLAFAWLVDLKRWKNGDFAYWLHLFGLMAFWGGLTNQSSNDEFGKALYCLVNVGLVFMALFLMRRAYAVFGAVGITIYLGHLAESVFKDSILFPFALSGIGVALIGAGLLFHRHRAAVEGAVAALLPEHLRSFRPAHTRPE